FSRCQAASSARRAQPSCTLDTCAHLRRWGHLFRLAWTRPLTFHTLFRDLLRFSIPQATAPRLILLIPTQYPSRIHRPACLSAVPKFASFASRLNDPAALLS